MRSERQGEIYIFFEALLWSLFPIITILSLKNIPTLISLGWSMLFATIFFALILSVKNKWGEITNREVWKDVLLAALILGILYYILFFSGLRYTSAGNAGLIATTEIFFTYLLFQVWRKDKLPKAHLAGAIFMLIGAVIILYPNTYEFRIGDILILAASFIAPFGNSFQKRARQKISSESILFVRCLLSAMVIFIFAYATGADFGALNFKNYSLILLIINGFFLLGLSKILWIEGIHRIDVTKAISLNSLTPFFTLVLAGIFLHDIPTKFQLLSFVPIFFGLFLLSRNSNRKTIQIETADRQKLF
jgi:drug/metabolite transporter (DMT)-like permease